jgi:hypothetical protein
MPSLLNQNRLRQVDELFVAGGSIDKGENGKSPDAFERTQRVMPSVGFVIDAVSPAREGPDLSRSGIPPPPCGATITR